MSLALWRGLRKLLRRKIDTGSTGFLEAANPSDSETPRMRILGSAVVPVVLESDSRVRDVVVRVVEDLPYGFIFGADYFRRNRSTLEFAPDKGFRPVPSAPWVPFDTAALDTSPYPNPLRAERDRLCMQPPPPEAPLPSPPAPAILPAVRSSYHDIAWEDESTLEWDIRQVAATTTVPGFTSIAVETAAVGPQPQHRQLVLMLPTERFDLEKGALVGVARALLWWLPGSPVYCKVVNRSKQTAEVEGNRVIARMIALNVRDPARFESFCDDSPASVDPPLPLRARDMSGASNTGRTAPLTKVQASDANSGTLGFLQKQQLSRLLETFIEDGLFPIDPKRVPARIDGAPSDFQGPRGPSLDGVWSAEIDAVGGAGTDSGDPFQSYVCTACA